MAKISINPITNVLTEVWSNDERNGLPYSGKAVREALQLKLSEIIVNNENKIGALWFDTVNMKLYTFKSYEDRDLFKITEDASLVQDVQDVIFAGKQRKIVVITDIIGTNAYFTSYAEKANINISFKPYEKELTDVDWTEVSEDATVTVSVDKGATGEFITAVDGKFLRYGDTLTVDIRPYLIMGQNRVRITVVGTTNKQISNFVFNANLTTMYLADSNFEWYKPFIEGEPYSLGGVNIGGSLDKKLFIKVTNELGYSKMYEERIGTAIYINNAYFYDNLEFPEHGTGVYNVEMWIEATGLESDHLTYNIMCIANADKYTKQLCCISNVAKTVSNYTTNTLFEYAVYNKGAVTASPAIELTSIINTNPTILKDEVLNNVDTGVALPYTINLEIESEDIHINLRAKLTYGIVLEAIYPVDNSKSYPATADAVFYMNPANRSNSQSNRESVLNEITKGTVITTFNNMSWVENIDGWTTDDNGRKCLFLPAFTKSVIEYNPLYNATTKTIEITYKAKNASDLNDNIITIYNYIDDIEEFVGIRIKPQEILVHSQQLYSDNVNQRYIPGDEDIINLIITIAPNYKKYGNLCKVYVNGVVKKEFEYTNNDNFATNFENGITRSYIELGSNSADLYVYNIRVYDKAFESLDAMKNYIASLPNSTEKRIASDLIESIVDDSYNIYYDKVRLVANVACIEMLDNKKIPSYGHQKEYKANCNLSVEWCEHPEFNYVINKIQIEGLGTTSMNYWLWNLRFRGDKSKDMVVTYANGDTATGGYWKFMGDVYGLLNRATGKINFASSMQSHKMGATAAFNDLHHALGLDNEAGGRVAVYQEPFYFFEKIPIEGSNGQYIYRFIGLFTFGADKGDKNCFGYNNEDFKDSLIHMEGTDHDPKGVGMEYPYDELVYISSEESICTDLGNGIYTAAWEVGECGGLEDEADIQAALDREFKPAYDVAYYNSTMIYGTTDSLETINTNPTAWNLLKDEDGHYLQRYEIWIDGEYDLYYLNKKTNTYVKNNVNLLTQLNISETELEGLTISEKNNLFKEKRRENFKAEVGTYWHIDDCLFCLCFLLLFGAKDNFKKNSYPYKFKLLSDGGKWRWRQDDLDTLFDINNQSIPDSTYSIDYNDWTDENKSAYAFKGEDSVFWTLLNECFPIEIANMGKRILDVMSENSGDDVLDSLMNFFDRYFWSKAQGYFTKSAYNIDAELKYEESWPLYGNTYQVDVHPLKQSLGDHLEAEKIWVKNRLIYMMSKWGYGPFAKYNDVSLGRITFRTQNQLDFTITPYMDLHPTILVGQSSYVRSNEKIKAGNPTIIRNVGGGNSNIYIAAADVIEDIGDLKNLAVDASSDATLGVSSKRLKTLKLGDESEEVTSNVSSLVMGECNSLMSIDARNLQSLTGTVDLSNCPRLLEAYFGGTNLTSINFANGSKITKILLPSSIQALIMQNLIKLTNLSYDTINNIRFLRIENCNTINPFNVLKEAYDNGNGQLNAIRLTGFNYEGTSDDVDLLSALITTTDTDGNRKYVGINNEGIIQNESLPVIDGHIKILGNLYKDTYDSVSTNFPNAILQFDGKFYVRFADPEVLRICVENFSSDDIGCTPEDLLKVTTLSTIFKNNTEIKTFNEFEQFTNCSSIASNAISECSNLEEVTLPESLTTLSYACLYNNDKLKKINGFNNIVNMSNMCCANNPMLEEVVGLNNVVNIETQTSQFSGCTALKRIVGSATITTIPSGFCKGNVSLKEVKFNGKIKSIGTDAFKECTALESVGDLSEVEEIKLAAFYKSGIIIDGDFPHLTTLGRNVFTSCPNVTRMTGLDNLVSMDDGSFSGCANLSEFTGDFKVVELPSSCFYGCSSLKELSFDRVETIGDQCFQSCTALESVSIPNVLTIGKHCFHSCTALESVSIPNVLTIGKAGFRDCPSLSTIGDTPYLTSLGDTVFYNMGSLEYVNTSNITEIPELCFNSCKKLNNLNLEKIVSIGRQAVSGCAALTGELYLPNILIILRNAFNNVGYTSIIITSSLTELPYQSSDTIITYCSNLQYVELPSTLTHVGNICRLCSKLTTVVIKAISPPTALNADFFKYTHKDLKIFVPAESVEAYKTATNWSLYADKIFPITPTEAD